MLLRITEINNVINEVVWGLPALILMIGTGLYLSAATGWFQFSQTKLWFNETFGSMFSSKKKSPASGISPFQATTTALASTIGTGNIVGVATAIVAGGAGAVFWMWVSAFLGMAVKYSEIVLAVSFRKKAQDGTYYGGPMYYIEQGLGKGFKWLSVLFSVFAIAACLGAINLNQSNSIAAAISGFGVKPLYTGIAVAFVTGLVIIRGIKGIASISEKLVPLMALFYLAGGLFAIFSDYGNIGDTFMLIIKQAFSFKAAGGGTAGYMMMKAVRMGFARGIFSNEAGLGSAPIAHAAADAKDPVWQGFWGVFEVFVDTILICSITAIVIINSGLHDSGLNGAALTAAAFGKYYGSAGSMFLSISIILFALTSILGWYYYSEQCLRYLFHDNKLVSKVYKSIYLLLIVVGAQSELTFVWSISDTLNGLMAIPNLIAVISLSDIVIYLTKRYIRMNRKKKNDTSFAKPGGLSTHPRTAHQTNRGKHGYN